MVHRLSLAAAVLSLINAPLLALAPDDLDYFEQHIRPVLAEHCYECHSGRSEEPEAGLRLDVKSLALKGGDSGHVIRPGNSKDSLLLWALRYDDRVSAMPPDEKLSPDVVENFAKWIDAGAVMPDDPADANSESGFETRANSVGQIKRTHWAFQPPQLAPSVSRGTHVHSSTNDPNGAVPNPTEASRPRVRFDHLIEDQLRQADLRFAPPASRDTLAKRLHIDLLGLPPTYEWVEQFKSDTSPDAYARRVERLLNSPRFGERWARHWLDVARFADTKGYVFTASREYPDAHKYREWVIRAFNEDRPFDEFLQYQLAADQLAGDSPEELAAMGYLTLGRRFLGNQHDIIDDRIDVTTRGLMGLTVTCARCHDHKYDPIPAADYYSLYGVFASSEEPSNAPSPLRLVDAAKPTDPYVFLRGKPGRRGDSVPRQFLEVLSPDDRAPFQNGSGRLELAQAITSAENPLTARVFVNRVWGQLMGQHLVDTPSDFGTRSSEPELRVVLDDLAVRFMKHGWSTKWLIREIVMSATYRQSSTPDPRAMQIDPENRLHHHQHRQRLDFEAMRDSLLLVSGRLDMTHIGGTSIDVTSNEPISRRSLYAKIDRQNFPGLFRTFDVASPDTHTPKRFETTVPQQALFLLNSPFILTCAETIASERDAEQPANEQLIQIYRRILGRDPAAWELAAGAKFIERRGNQQEAARWADLAQVLLVSNEFFFTD